MGIAAAGQIKLMAPGKSVGMYRTEQQPPTLRALVDKVIAVYDFKEVHVGEATVGCARRERAAARVVSAVPACGIDVADVLVQFNSVQIARDTGYVGGYVTEVLRGESRARTSAFCILTARHGADWVGVTNVTVPAPRDCANDRKH